MSAQPPTPPFSHLAGSVWERGSTHVPKKFEIFFVKI